MTFDFAAYLDLADQLATGQSESCYRSATSRAYYAFYHLVGRAAVRQDPNLSAFFYSGPGHGKFFSELQKSSCALKGLAQTGHTLRGYRNQADYDKKHMTIAQAQNQAELACELARQQLKKYRLV